MSDILADLIRTVVEFREERDWTQFHTPKETATALAIEASELQDLYLWNRDPDLREVGLEFGDLLVFALSFAERTKLDPVACVHAALDKARRKYPVAKCKGSNLKYNQR